MSDSDSCRAAKALLRLRGSPPRLMKKFHRRGISPHDIRVATILLRLSDPSYKGFEPSPGMWQSCSFCHRFSVAKRHRPLQCRDKTLLWCARRIRFINGKLVPVYGFDEDGNLLMDRHMRECLSYQVEILMRDRQMSMEDAHAAVLIR